MLVEPGVPVSGLFLILHGVLLIETADDTSSWVTVGVGHNVVEASWAALLDAVTYGLRRVLSPPLVSPPPERSDSGVAIAT